MTIAHACTLLRPSAISLILRAINLRSQTLYPAELRARRSANAVKIDYDTPPRSSTRRIAFTGSDEGKAGQIPVAPPSENRAMQFQLV